MNRKRLLAAVMYIAVIVFVYAYIFITGGMFVNADGVANAHYQAYNIEKPSIVATDESLGRIDVYAAGKGYITAFRIDKDSSIYARGFMVDGGVIATDDNVVAHFYEDIGAVLGACDIPGAAEVRFELCIPGTTDSYELITAPLNLDGCFMYDRGGEYSGEEPYVTYAEALDTDGNVLCTSTGAHLKTKKLLHSPALYAKIHLAPCNHAPRAQGSFVRGEEHEGRHPPQVL